jgi:hypothetical protein
VAEQSTRLTRATNGPYLPHIGTSPSVVDTRSAVQFTSPPTSGLMEPSTERSALREVLALSFGDQVREILAALSLNKSQLAEALGCRGRRSMIGSRGRNRMHRTHNVFPTSFACW